VRNRGKCRDFWLTCRKANQLWIGMFFFCLFDMCTIIIIEVGFALPELVVHPPDLRARVAGKLFIAA
jgi:hypothetical protein